MSQLNVSVLAVARETYTEQLKSHLTPLIYQGFVSLYEESKMKEKERPEFNYNYLKRFQTLLRDVPYWNQSILEEETRRIQDSFDYLMELLAAIFVSYVKILASVRLRGEGNNIKIKLPTSVIFIHTVYIKSAEYIYYNPKIFLNYHIRENVIQIYEMINRSIEDTINSMIPIENLLKEYLSNVFNENVKEEKIEEKVEETPFSAIFNSKDLENNTAINEDFKIGDKNINNDDLLGNIYAGTDNFNDELKTSKQLSPETPFNENNDIFKSDMPTDDIFKSDMPTDDIFKSDIPTIPTDTNLDPFSTNDKNNNNEMSLPSELNKDDIFFSDTNKQNPIDFKDELL